MASRIKLFRTFKIREFFQDVGRKVEKVHFNVFEKKNIVCTLQDIAQFQNFKDVKKGENSKMR